MNANAAEKPGSTEIGMFVEQLRRRGIGDREFKRAARMPDVMDEVAAAMRIREVPLIELSGDPDRAALKRLVNDLFGRSIERANSYKGGPWFASRGDGYAPEDLYEPELFSKLLEGMDPKCQTVLVMRNGLLDGEAIPQGVLAERYGVEGGYIGNLHRRARQHMKAQQKKELPLLIKRPFPYDELFEELPDEVLDTTIAEYFDRSYDTIPLIQPLNDAGIITVRDLKNLPVRQAARLLIGDEVHLPLEWFPRYVHTS